MCSKNFLLNFEKTIILEYHNNIQYSELNWLFKKLGLNIVTSLTKVKLFCFFIKGLKVQSHNYYSHLKLNKIKIE